MEAVGTAGSLSQAIRFVAQRGVVHFIGCAATTTVDLAPAWFKEVDVVGSFCHAADWHAGELVHSFDRALAIMAAGDAPLDPLITHELPAGRPPGGVRGGTRQAQRCHQGGGTALS